MKTITITAYKTRGTRDHYTIDATYRGKIIASRDHHSPVHDALVTELIAHAAVHGFSRYRLNIEAGMVTNRASRGLTAVFCGFLSRLHLAGKNAGLYRVAGDYSGAAFYDVTLEDIEAGRVLHRRRFDSEDGARGFFAALGRDGISRVAALNVVAMQSKAAA